MIEGLIQMHESVLFYAILPEKHKETGGKGTKEEEERNTLLNHKQTKNTILLILGENISDWKKQRIELTKMQYLD